MNEQSLKINKTEKNNVFQHFHFKSLFNFQLLKKNNNLDDAYKIISQPDITIDWLD